MIVQECPLIFLGESKLIPTSQEAITFNLSINPHVFIEPFTPPVPLLICLIAAGLAVIASFVVVGFFARNPKVHRSYPQINIGNWKLVKILSSRFTIITIQISSVLLFTLLLLTGFIGNPDPLYNLAPTLVWVIWWVGVAYLSAFIGDVWLLLNPWSIVFSWVEYIWRLFHSGKSLSPLMKYPIKAGVWPALSFFVIFAWIENVYPDAVIPLRISQMIILYSVFTWIGMILFGKKIWLNHGETFSLAFGFLAKFAPIATTSLNNKFNETETNRPMDILRNHDDSELETQRSKAIILRPFAAGLLNTGKGSTSKMLFILFLFLIQNYYTKK